MCIYVYMYIHIRLRRAGRTSAGPVLLLISSLCVLLIGIIVYIYIYIYIHIYIYIYIHTYIPIYTIYTYTHIPIYLYMHYTRSPLEDSRLFGPSPWKILATTYKETISEQPSPWRKSSKRESCYGDRVYLAGHLQGRERGLEESAGGGAPAPRPFFK